MKKANRSPRFWIVVALIICLISSVGASLIQSNGGKVEVTEIDYITQSGLHQNAMLLKPKTATSENPAPAILVSEGWYNTKEFQDLNFVEYARRGYVVLAINMYGHGDSETIEPVWMEDPLSNANGLYDGIKYLHTLPFVDKTKVAVSGHSYGGYFSSRSCMLDNLQEDPLISAAVIVCEEPELMSWDPDAYVGMFGTRDVMIVTVQYDEWYHRVEQADGTYSPAREFIHQYPAQAFLNFYADDTEMEVRDSYTIYHKEIDGVDVMREIINPPITHPVAHFSSNVVSYSCDFLNESFGQPDNIPGSSQIWQWKVVFNTIGLIGFFMFLINAALAMLDLPYFKELKATAPVEPLPAPSGKGKAWYWGGLVFGAVFGAVVYVLLYSWAMGGSRPSFFTQEASWYIGTWSAICGIATVLIMIVSYHCYSKKNGLDLAERGIKISGKKLWKSVVLSLFAVFSTFSLVFLSDYFFHVDFRCWCFMTIRAFSAEKLVQTGKYLIFWLIYYIALSVVTNGFNYVKIGKKNWISCAIQMFFVFIGPEIIVLTQYITFYITGWSWTELHFPACDTMAPIWLYSILVILPLAAFVCRKIYQKTKNPYIGGIIMGVTACIITTTNTLTQIGLAAGQAW